MSRLYKPLSFLLAVTLGLSVTSCSAPESSRTTAPTSQNQVAVQLPDGQYPVQQATYDDGTGEYSLLLLNTPPDRPSSLRTANLPLAQLTPDEAKAGKQSFLKVEGGKPSLYLKPDAKIEYVHNVTETRTDPQSGQPQTVVVRQESSFWSPFVAGVAGAAVGNLLFAPRYYVPPIYSPGGLSGYGGYGSTYGQAVNQYQSRYNSSPAAVRNSTALRTTGIGGSSRVTPGSSRSSGSGFGGSTLRSTSPFSGSSYGRNSRSGFGSSRSRSFGGRRR